MKKIDRPKGVDEELVDLEFEDKIFEKPKMTVIQNTCYECGCPVDPDVHFCEAREGEIKCSEKWFSRFKSPKEAKLALAKVTRNRKKNGIPII